MIPEIPAGHNTGTAPDRLLRWSVLGLFLLALLATIHFTRGLLLPSEFVRFAEETGMIIEIGRMLGGWMKAVNARLKDRPA